MIVPLQTTRALPHPASRQCLFATRPCACCWSLTTRHDTSASFRVAVQAVATEPAVAPAESAAVAVEEQAATVVTSVTQWQSKRTASQMGRKERAKSLAMRRSMVKASHGPPSLLHARRAFARKRATTLPVSLQHRAPAPVLPLPSHGLQMAKVRQESGEADSMMAHVMEEHAALQQHLESIVEPTIKPDSEVRAMNVGFPVSYVCRAPLLSPSGSTDTANIVTIAVRTGSSRGIRSCARIA